MHIKQDKDIMKINFIVPVIGHSGGIDIIYKYSRLLIEQGHNVCVYKAIKANNMHRYKSDIKNNLHQLYCTIKSIFSYKKYQQPIDKIVWSINDKSIRDADIVIATAWPTAYLIMDLSKQKGNKFYFIQDYEVWDNIEQVQGTYKLPLNKIVVSSWINNKLNNDLGIGPFPVIYNGLDLQEFHRIKVIRESNKINFLMLNHTLSKKGVDLGLKVFEKIKNKYPNCNFRMFGMCNNKNLPSYIEYFQNPSHKELVELYSQTDFFIFPSLEEGWGLTPLEAMACGCIVIGTNVGFVLDLGKHRENMMISNPGDINGMVNNIIELISDEELRNRIKCQSMADIKQLNWKISANQLEERLMLSIKNK